MKKSIKKETRSDIINTVQTPLGFFVLIVLIVEVIFGIITSFSEGQDRTILIIGMLLLILSLVIIVAVMAFLKPAALYGKESKVRNKTIKTNEFNINKDNDTSDINEKSIIEKLNVSDSIASFKTAESRFLQVLVSNFSLNRSEKGVILDIYLDDNVLAIWSRQGKSDLESIILYNQIDKVQFYQNKLENFLIREEGNNVDFDDDQFYFRYGSGGILPIVKINNIEYYCLIYREIFPIGWNIANGGTDSREELLEPAKAMIREMNEELIILDDEKKKRYFFGESPDMPEFIIVRELLKSLIPNLNLDELDEYQPEIYWENGPDEVRVRLGKGAQRTTTNCFININATDLGIEIDRIASFKVDDTAIFFDGELCDGETPGFSIVNAPIGLFSVDRINNLVRGDSNQFVPDFFYWNGIKFNGDQIEEYIREKFIPSMAMDMSEKEKIYFHSKGTHILDLCPVTKNIIRRSEGYKRAAEPINEPDS